VSSCRVLHLLSLPMYPVYDTMLGAAKHDTMLGAAKHESMLGSAKHESMLGAAKHDAECCSREKHAWCLALYVAWFLAGSCQVLTRSAAGAHVQEWVEYRGLHS
jgi:hypothetical protein